MTHTIEQAIPARTTEQLRINFWQILFVVFVILSISICEYVFTYQNVAFGIVSALALTILIYFVVSVSNLDQRIAACAESLVLVPLYILFTSSLPWFLVNQQYLLPLVYTCIIGLCLWHILQNNLSLKEIFGFNKGRILKYSLIGLVIGIPTGVVEYLILQPAPTFPEFSLIYFFRDMVYMFICVSVAEEVLFRGLIQKDLAVAFGWKWALFGSSILFMVMHLTWRSIPELGFVFIAGLIFGGLYLKTRSLVAPIMMHGVNNLILVAVAPYVLG
ncbi:lysostaphin resistance A-like protein [Chloroflexota bacterium]